MLFGKKRIFDVEQMIKETVTFSDNFAIWEHDGHWETPKECLVFLETMRVKGYIPCSKLGDTVYVIFYKNRYR